MKRFLLILLLLLNFLFYWTPAAQASQAEDYTLAIRWQPGFCETKPKKIECRGQTADRFDGQNFTLHGLWPEESYCGVSPEVVATDEQKHWDKLPEIELTSATRKALATKMPGYRSNLHLHEWYKHGSCYSSSAETYFHDMIALLDQINDSDVKQLFLENLDRDLTSEQIRDRFSQAFGKDAGRKVQVECEKDINQAENKMIVDLEINLSGEIGKQSLRKTIQQGRSVAPGCPIGEVDRAGIDD
jgi:ribonuclease T2